MPARLFEVGDSEGHGNNALKNLFRAVPSTTQKGNCSYAGQMGDIPTRLAPIPEPGEGMRVARHPGGPELQLDDVGDVVRRQAAELRPVRLHEDRRAGGRVSIGVEREPGP